MIKKMLQSGINWSKKRRTQGHDIFYFRGNLWCLQQLGTDMRMIPMMNNYLPSHTKMKISHLIAKQEQFVSTLIVKPCLFLNEIDWYNIKLQTPCNRAQECAANKFVTHFWIVHFNCPFSKNKLSIFVNFHIFICVIFFIIIVHKKISMCKDLFLFNTRKFNCVKGKENYVVIIVIVQHWQ